MGLGDYVKFPSGLKRFLLCTLSLKELCALCPFIDRRESPQSYIAAWELVAKSALLWTIQSMLPAAHPCLHVCLRCDNAASEPAAWKGLSMSRGLCAVLFQFGDMQRRFCISARIEHVPGFLNDIADSLSRSVDPSSLGFSDEERLCPPWREFLVHFKPRSAPLEVYLRSSVPALS